MTAVTIRGTFSKDERPSNGLEEIADDLLAKQFDTHYVVGIVQFAGSNRPGPGEHEVPAVKFLGIEPLTGTAAEGAAALLDAARKQRGLGRMEESIPARDTALFDFDEDGKPTMPDSEGEAETRLGPDGEHVVPPPSAEEVVAELDERRAKKTKDAKGDPFDRVADATKPFDRVGQAAREMGEAITVPEAAFQPAPEAVDG